MGNASTRCPLGLLKLAQICHKIFSRLLSLWDEGDEFSKSDDTFFKGYAGMKERKKRKKSLRQKGTRTQKGWTKKERKPKSIAADTGK